MEADHHPDEIAQLLAEAKQGKELFRRLSEALPQLVYTALPNGVFDYFNHRWEEYTGIKPEDTPQFWKAIIHPGDLQKMYNKWHADLAAGNMYEQEYLIRDRFGVYRWHLCRAFPAKDANGRVTKWFGACTNIEAQKKEEDRIARLQEVTSALSRAVTQSEIGAVLIRYINNIFRPDSVSLALLTFDNSAIELTETQTDSSYPQRRINIALPKRLDSNSNHPACRFLRFQQPLFLQTPDEVISEFPDNRSASCLVILPLFFQNRSLGVLSLSFNNPRVFLAEEKNFFGTVAQQVSQALERARLFESELSLRHRAEDSQHRFKFLAEASMILAGNLDHLKTLKNIVAHPVPYFADACIVDLVGEDNSVNRIALSHLNPEHEIHLREIGKTSNFTKTFPLNKVLSDGESILLVDMEGRTKNMILEGREQIAEHYKALQLKSLILVRLGPKENPIGVMTFLTSTSGRVFTKEDVSLGEELGWRATMAIENARLYAQAQKAISMRDEFISIASHELKTPLTSINLQLQLVKRHNIFYGNDKDRLVKALDVFDRQSDRLSKLVDSLLDISFIQAGKLSLQIELIDLSDLVNQIVERFPLTKIQLDLKPGVKGFWDRSRLDQVIVNLISNGIKYGENKPLLLKVDSSPGGASVSVEDRGPGIPKEDQTRIFDRFQRAVSDRTTWGMGLGLYIARQIVEAHHGKITLESRPGEGSIFKVELPGTLVNQVGLPTLEKTSPSLFH